MMAPRRLSIAASLGLQFLTQVVLSGLTTAWLIVRPGPWPRSGLLRMRYENLSETGAAVLGCLVTLTPGSTVVDIDPERRELLLHLLDASNPRATVANIRRRISIPLQGIFPGGGTR